MDYGGRTIPRKYFPQTGLVGQIADFERTPLDRFRIAAREIVVSNWLEPGVAQRLCRYDCRYSLPRQSLKSGSSDQRPPNRGMAII